MRAGAAGVVGRVPQDASGGPLGPPSPASIENLELWLHVDDFTGAAWPDRSGNGRHASQATEALRGTFGATAVGGQPGVSFNGSQYMNLVSLPNANSLTVLARCSFTAAAPTAALLGWTGSLGVLFERSLSVAIADPSFRLCGATANGNQVLTWRIDAAGPNFAAFRNGAALAAATTYDGTWGNSASARLCSIGGGSPTWHPTVALREVLVYSRALSTGERELAEGILV
jgi:hypothetical protein